MARIASLYMYNCVNSMTSSGPEVILVQRLAVPGVGAIMTVQSANMRG